MEEYKINHKFKELVVVPFVAIHNNFDFLLSDNKKILIFADGIKAKVLNYQIKHICEIEDIIKHLYQCDAWTFLKKWYRSQPAMDSMRFLIISVIAEN